MKKTYIAPAATIVALHAEEAMLATSLNKYTDKGGDDTIYADGEEGLSDGRSFDGPFWGTEE